MVNDNACFQSNCEFRILANLLQSSHHYMDTLTWLSISTSEVPFLSMLSSPLPQQESDLCLSASWTNLRIALAPRFEINATCSGESWWVYTKEAIGCWVHFLILFLITIGKWIMNRRRRIYSFSSCHPVRFWCRPSFEIGLLFLSKRILAPVQFCHLIQFQLLVEDISVWLSKKNRLMEEMKALKIGYPI